jgi:hypothetical protein
MEIERDLEILSLQRQIALEELKIEKNNVEDSLKPVSIIYSVFRTLSKYGFVVLFKKFFK